MQLELFRSALMGQFDSGKVGSVGYTVYDSSGNITTNRTTSGIFEMSTSSGAYGAMIAFPSSSFTGYVYWDDGGSPISQAFTNINPADFLQAKIDGTVESDVLAGLTAQGYTTSLATALGESSGTVTVSGYTTSANPANILATSFASLSSSMASYFNTLESLSTSILSALGGISGTNTVTFNFVDEDSNPVPYVLFSLAGLASATTGVNGQVSLSLASSTYTINATPNSGVAWSTSVIDVTGSQSFTFVGSAVVNPTPVLPSSTSHCVLSLALDTWLGNEYATLTTTSLPQCINGRFLREGTQRPVLINDYGYFTFSQVAYGAEVKVTVQDAGVFGTLLVPPTSTAWITSSLFI